MKDITEKLRQQEEAINSRIILFTRIAWGFIVLGFLVAGYGVYIYRNFNENN